MGYESGGIIEGGSRILKEILQTPRFKQTIKILLRELDPENTPKFVRALTQSDPDLFLGLLGASPKLINVGLEGAGELLRNISNFPPALLADFLKQLATDLDADQLGQSAALALVMIVRVARDHFDSLNEAVLNLSDEFDASFTDTCRVEGFEKAELARQLVETMLRPVDVVVRRIESECREKDSTTKALVQALAEGILQLGKDHPDFIADVVSPLVEAGRQAIDGQKKAAPKAKAKPKAKTKG